MVKHKAATAAHIPDDSISFEIRTEVAKKRAIVGAVIRGSAPKLVLGHVLQSADELGEYVRHTTDKLIRPFVESGASATSPTEVEIEFGIKVAGKATIYIVEGSSESHIRVKAKWIRPNLHG